MPASVFELSTTSSSINQGQYGPSVAWERIRGMIVTPADYFLTKADYAGGIKAKLQADAISDDADERIQIIGPFQEAEAANTNPVTLEYGYGLSQELYSGQYGARFFFGDGDLSRQQQRQKLKGQESSHRIFLFDESSRIIGTVGDDGTGASVHTGFTPGALIAGDVALDYGQGAKQSMYVSLADRAELNNGNLLVIATSGLNPNALKLVADVHIQAISDLTTRVVTLAFMSVGSNSGLNLAERFATELVANPDLILFTNHNTGAALTITTAVAAVINGQHGITYTLAVTNYPTSGNGIDIVADSVSALATDGLKYYETPETLYIPV